VRPLLIGVGNDFAGDDGAGRLVARGLAGCGGLDVVECHGAAADLVTYMEGRGEVIIVDACVSGAAAGQVQRIDGLGGGLPPWLRSVSSHGIGVAEAVQLAGILGSLPDRLEIIAIEGTAFAVGDAMTPAVAAAVDALVAELRA